jgi:hypothetical protein
MGEDVGERTRVITDVERFCHFLFYIFEAFHNKAFKDAVMLPILHVGWYHFICFPVFHTSDIKTYLIVNDVLI